MSIDPSTYPSRAFIRFTAQNQIRADLTGQSFTANVKRSNGESYAQQVAPSPDAEPINNTAEAWFFDEVLFEEIAKTTFNSNRYPELFESCGTQRAAKAVEARIADELVAAYKQIKRKQECLIVQSLNALL